MNARIPRIVGSFALMLSFWYVATYILMMDWRQQAFDAVGHHYVHHCAYRCAPIVSFHVKSQDLPNIYMRELRDCWANRVFWPADLLVGQRNDCTVVFEDADAEEGPRK